MVDEETTPQGDDPTEVLPLLRHHVHEAYYALECALGKAQAEDLVQGYRDGQLNMKSSKLTTQIERAAGRLAGYLGFLDEVEDESNE